MQTPPAPPSAILGMNQMPATVPVVAPPPVPATIRLGSDTGNGNRPPPPPPVVIDTTKVQDVGKAATQMTPDSLIDYAQNIRKAVVDGYVLGGVVPRGTADKLMFSSMLKDLTDTEFAKKKQETDAKNGADSAMVAAVLAAIPRRQPSINTDVTDVTPKMVPNTIPTAPLVPGEAETEPAQMDINSFMAGTTAPVAEPAKKKK